MGRIDNAVIKAFEIFLSLCNGLDFALPYLDNAPSKGFRSASLRASRATLRSIFSSQNPTLDFG
ncbi:hypothetical protein, partial [uncultured Duncaniella sp.]|uniref:hypothetical protein n=1 Tax=uncultured Duncaniella sp. TaxID=2768039 RepID=UPI0025A64417